MLSVLSANETTTWMCARGESRIKCRRNILLSNSPTKHYNSPRYCSRLRRTICDMKRKLKKKNRLPLLFCCVSVCVSDMPRGDAGSCSRVGSDPIMLRATIRDSLHVRCSSTMCFWASSLVGGSYKCCERQTIV
jgi:hypothetical protein